jgi:hypothetical protein
MSILDSVMSAVEQHSELNQEQHSSLAQSALQMFGSHAGLSSLVKCGITRPGSCCAIMDRNRG